MVSPSSGVKITAICKVEGKDKGPEVESQSGMDNFGNSEFEWTPGVGDGQGGLAFCDSWGCKESDTTKQMNWTEIDSKEYVSIFRWICFYAKNFC